MGRKATKWNSGTPILKEKKHPILSPESVIWRFMDMPRFVALLEKRAPYLTRVGILSDVDPYEGQLPSWIAEQMSQAGSWRIDTQDITPAAAERMRAQIGPMFVNQLERTSQERVFVNCWHMNKHESDAMWRLYSMRGQGIAIKSTVGRLARLGESGKQVQAA